MKFSWNGYWKPTPKLIRKFADSLLIFTMSLSTASFATDHEKWAFGLMIAGALAKFASNFFSEDK